MADMEAVLQKTVDYFGGHIPGVAAFLVKIIVCIVIYIIGKNVIFIVRRKESKHDRRTTRLLGQGI